MEYSKEYIEKIEYQNRLKFSFLYPDFKVRVIRLYQDMWANYRKLMRCTYSVRSIAEQDELYEYGRSKPGSIVTRAKGGLSAHNYGIAIDSCFAGLDPFLEKISGEESTFLWHRYGQLGEAHGMKWGKPWHDLPHLELTYGISMEDIHNHYKEGGLKQVWSNFDKIRNVPIASEWGHVVDFTEKQIGG